MRFCSWIVVALVIVLAACGGAPTEEPAAQAYEPTWESLGKHNPAPDWFRDAKYGIYFHWGVYSVPAYGSEWYPRWMLFKGHDIYKHHVKTYGDPSEFGYHDFVPMFKAEKFNAEEWADLFQKAGARFAGPVAEHHDGFSMWASKVNPWNVMDKGPKRDITGELEKAIRARGMKFVATFHHARNLQRLDQPGEPYPDGRHFRNSHYPPVEGYPSSTDDPELQQLYGRIPEEQFLAELEGEAGRGHRQLPPGPDLVRLLVGPNPREDAAGVCGLLSEQRGRARAGRRHHLQAGRPAG